MRRTQQEFKAEVFRRSSAYQQRRNANRRNALTALACVALVIWGIGVLPRGFDAAAGETSAPMMMDKVDESAEAPEEPAAAPEEPRAEHTVASSIYVERIADGVKKHLGLAEGERMTDFLANTEWATMRHQCASEYVIMDAFGKPYGYDPDCGVIYDPQTEMHSAPLPEDIQKILDRYCD